MYVESFHNRLKTYYMERRPNKRLDDLINLLLEIEKDDYWRHKRQSYFSSDITVKKTEDRLLRGLNIPDAHVTIMTDDEKQSWEIQSQSKESVTYTVTMINETCDCTDKVTTDIVCVGLYTHLFRCNCLDSNRLCKHIYKIQSLQNRPMPTINDYKAEESEKDSEDYNHDESNVYQHQPEEQSTNYSPLSDPKKELAKFDAIINKIKVLVINPTVQTVLTS